MFFFPFFQFQNFYPLKHEHPFSSSSFEKCIEYLVCVSITACLWTILHFSALYKLKSRTARGCVIEHGRQRSNWSIRYTRRLICPLYEGLICPLYVGLICPLAKCPPNRFQPRQGRAVQDSKYIDFFMQQIWFQIQKDINNWFYTREKARYWWGKQALHKQWPFYNREIYWLSKFGLPKIWNSYQSDLDKRCQVAKWLCFNYIFLYLVLLFWGWLCTKYL